MTIYIYCIQIKYNYTEYKKNLMIEIYVLSIKHI